MMRPKSFPAWVFLAAVLALSCGRSEEDRAVSDLLREATQVIRMAERERPERPRDAEYLERQAMEVLDELVNLYPDSPRVEQLLEDEIRIGPYTYSSLQAEVERQREALAPVRAEEEDPVWDVLELAGELAGRPGPPYFQAGVLSRIALAYSRRGDAGLAEEFFYRARMAVDLVEAPYFRILSLLELGGQYFSAGLPEEEDALIEEARDLTGRIDYPFFRSGALAAVAARCLARGREDEAFEIFDLIDEPYYRSRFLIGGADRLLEEGRNEEAADLLARAREDSSRITDPVYQVELITEAAGREAVWRAPEEPVGLEEAFALSLNLVDPVPRAGSLTRIASWYGRIGERDRAIELLKQAAGDAGLIRDNIFKDLVLLEIVESLAGMEEFERARETAGLIEDDRYQALALAAISRGYDLAGREGNAVETAVQARDASREIANPHFRADVLIRIADTISPPIPAPLPEEPPPPPETDTESDPVPGE